MTSSSDSLTLLLAYQRVMDFMSALAEERSELGELARQLKPDLEAIRPKAPNTHH